MMTTIWNQGLSMLWRRRELIRLQNRCGCQQYLRFRQQTPNHFIHAQQRHRVSCSKRLRHGMSVTTKTRYNALEEPSIIYSDNHLLIVDKPPGWHSVPNPTKSSKCLLSKLRDMQLGGGSRQDFLLPIHRIDQPCSGLLLFGKTSKAASRITKLWKKKQVQKFYLAAVPSFHLEALQRHSIPCDDPYKGNDWFTLKGILEHTNAGKQQRSVRIRPLTESNSQEEDSQKKGSTRILSVNWKAVKMPGQDDSISSNNPHSMLLVRSADGARHVVRALLAQVGKCPIQGDLRYGGGNQYSALVGVLPDQSVALHAYRIHLDEKLQLGSLTTFEFESPFPASWESFFGFSSAIEI